MSHHLQQGAISVQFGQTSSQQATNLALGMSQVGIVDAGAAGALKFAADRTG